MATFLSPILPLRRPTPEHEHEHDSHEAAIVWQVEEQRDMTSEHDRRQRRRRTDGKEEGQESISIPANTRLAEDAVMPFLNEHIPTQYNHASIASSQRQQLPTADDREQQPLQMNTKYCYRHQPDMKCRRQANEPSMEQLQNELAVLSHSDQQAISHVWSLFSAAPRKHRELMLQGLLAQCCFPQLSYLSATVRDLIKIDFLSALPAELGFKILCYLDTTSLCKAAQVSQRWRSLADDDVVWHKMCEQHIDRKCTKCGWGLPLLERKRLRTEKRQIQLRATAGVLPEHSSTDSGLSGNPRSPVIADKTPTLPAVITPSKHSLDKDVDECAVKRQCTQPRTERSIAEPQSEPKRRPWKDVYKDRYKVGSAWKHGRFSTRVFRGHSNGVMCLQFDDNVLISGSYDSTIKVWDVNTCAELRTLKGHRSGIRCLQFDENKLMSGSLDGTLKLWDWRKGDCLRTFHAHTAGVVTLHFTRRFVASGSMDKTIRVWDADTKQTFLLRGHKDWVNSVKLDEASRTLFSASDDLTIRLWDLDTRKCIRVFEGHVGQVQQVQPLPHEFELDDCKTSHPDKEDDASSVSSVALSNHDSLSTDIPFFWPDDPKRAAPPRYMLTGALDSTIRLWNVHFLPPVPGKLTTSSPPTSSLSSTSNPFTVLPTDPLTNSHTPRAQACIRTFFGHVEGIWSLAADHLRMVSGSEDCMLKIWDPRTGKCERTFTGHAGPVTCAWLTDSRIASGSEDCAVRMICFGDA